MLQRLYRDSLQPLSEKVGIHPYLEVIHNKTNLGNFVQLYSRTDLRNHADTLYEFSASERVEISQPMSPSENSIPKALAEIEGEYELEQPFVADIRNGRVLEKMGVCTTEDCTLILETANSREDRVRGYLAYYQNYTTRLLWNQLNPPDPTDNYGLDTAVSFIRMPDPHDPNRSKERYSHWIQSYLTRIEGLIEYETRTGKRPKIIVEASPPRWILDSLRFYGYTEDDIVFWDPTEEIRIQTLVIPSIRRIEVINGKNSNTSFKILSPNAARWLREESLTRLSSQFDREFSENIFILRTDADRRRFVNRDDIAKELKKEGFETYVLSELSFEEQVRLFSGADKVVAAHGAALANMIFCNNCEIIEIFGEYIKPTYYYQARSLGLDYTGIVGEGRGSGGKYDLDLYVEPERILHCI